MSRNPGTLVKVIAGSRSGQCGIIYDREQEQKFIDAGKRYVHFYADWNLTEFKGKGLINIDFLTGIGKYD